MDSDEPYKQKQTSNILFATFNVFQPVWVRCIVQNDDGINGFLLDYGFNFLPYIGLISWIIFILT
jgi:hypothetical protein